MVKLVNKDNNKNGWMFVLNGKRLEIRNPDPDCFDIVNIAHSLAMIPRFGAQSQIFYSVAQHSIHVSSLLPLEYKLYGLLHDGPEFALMDLPRPLKYIPSILKAYKPIENKLMKVIAKKFKFSMGKKATAAVKEVDRLVGFTEMRDLINLPKDYVILGPTLPNIDLSKEKMTWEEAKQKFLETYATICNQTIFSDHKWDKQPKPYSPFDSQGQFFCHAEN